MMKKQSSDKKDSIKKILGIAGIVLVIAHLTYYFIKPYDFIWFVLGFAVIYVAFVLPLKYWK